MTLGPHTAEARRLHTEEGWGYKRIGKHFGVGRETARSWVNPARRRRLERRRRQRRAGPCVDCGGVTTGERCTGCRSVAALEADALLVAAWFADWTVQEIADELDCSKHSVVTRAHRLRRQGVPLLPYGAYGRDPGEDAVIVGMYLGDCSLKEIGEQIGMGVSNVASRLTKLRRAGHELPYRLRPYRAA